MAPTPSLTIIKSFQYRGKAEEWSNTYHFSGGTPSDSTAWKALADAVIAQEKTVYTNVVSVVRAYGHAASNPIAVWSYDYALNSASVPGTFSPTAAREEMPGDCAGWLRWQTANFTTRGKRIYLRKYFHDVFGQAAPSQDLLLGQQKTAYEAYGAAWVTGFISATYKIAGPQGAAGSSPSAGPYVTTRTLKRRGKRP